jgi:hypothetical protein
MVRWWLGLCFRQLLSSTAPAERLRFIACSTFPFRLAIPARNRRRLAALAPCSALDPHTVGSGVPFENVGTLELIVTAERSTVDWSFVFSSTQLAGGAVCDVSSPLLLKLLDLINPGLNLRDGPQG